MVDQGVSRSRKSSKNESVPTSDIEMEAEEELTDHSDEVPLNESPVIQSNGGGAAKVATKGSPTTPQKSGKLEESPKLCKSTLRNGKRIRRSSPTVNGARSKSEESLNVVVGKDLNTSLESQSVISASLQEDDDDMDSAASLDSSLSRPQNPQQLIAMIDDALSGDVSRHVLERICHETCDQTISQTCSLLSDAQAVKLYLLLLKNDCIGGLFGTMKWIRHLLAEKPEPILKDKLAAQESRPLEGIVLRRHRITELSCQLRGKMDFIMANYKRSSSPDTDADDSKDLAKN